MKFERVSPTESAEASALLDDYFDERAANFPSGSGEYQVVFPPASRFSGPHDRFLIVRDDDGVAIGCGGIRAIDVPSSAATAETGADDADGAGSAEGAGFAEGAAPAHWSEVKHVWIEPHHRGRGYAAGLMAELERLAVESGATRIVLDTHSSLDAAAGLYGKLGYQAIEPYNSNTNADRWYGKAIG